MRIEKFEDLIAWQEARKLANLVYGASKRFEATDRSLARQMQRAAVSVMSNISEGFGRHTFNDSKQFFTVSRGSVSEIQSHLYIAKDCSYITEQIFDELYLQAVKVNRLVNGMIQNARKQLINSRTHELKNPRT